jgi:fibronectin-binding autotransporter adhesin
VDFNLTLNSFGAISGAGGLTKAGAGTLILGFGNNSYAGGTTTAEGTLQVGPNNAIPADEPLTLGGGTTSGTLDLHGGIVQVSSLATSGTGTANTITNSNSGNAIFTVNNATTQSYGGLLTGSLAFSKTGSGMLTLGNTANTYTNGTNLAGGTLAVAADGALGASSSGLAIGGGTLETTATFSTSRVVTLNGGGTFSPDSGTTLTLSTAITGTGGLTKSGGGTLVLPLANSYSGGTTITGGTLPVSADGTLGAAAGGLTLGGGTLEATATFSSARPVALNPGGGVFSVDSGVTLTLSSGLSGAGGLTKKGTGTLILSADNTSYTGGVTISGGALQLGNANGLAGGTVTLSVANGLTFGSLSAATLGGLAGGSNLNLGSTNLIVGGNNANTTYSGVLSGSGSLTKTGTGTFTLSGNDSAYAGGVTISAGVLRIGNSGALSGSTVTVNVDGGLDLGGSGGQTLGALGGSGNLALGNTDLTVGGDNASTTYSGVLSGNGLFTKTGTGTMTLSNASNSYTRGTKVTGGVLSIAADGALGGASAALTLNGGTLQFTGTGAVSALGASRPVSLGTSGGTIDTSGLGALTGNVITIPSVISGTGPLTLNAHGDTSDTGNGSSSELVLSGANTVTGTVTINSGLVDAGSNFGNAANTISINGVGGLVDTTGTVSVNRNIALAGTGDRIFRVYGSSQLGVSGVISGSGSLRKTDSGTLVLSGANAYTGGTTVGAGTLAVAADNALGAAAGGLTFTGGTLKTTASFTSGRGVTVNSGGGTVSVDSGANLTLSGTLLGVGTLTSSGTGNLTLTGSGSSLYSMTITAGAVTLNGGSLALTSQSNVNQPNRSVEVGGSSTPALLTVQGRAILDTSAAGEVVLGFSSAPQAMIVQGAGTLWKLPLQTDVGGGGTGSLIVAGGATLTGGPYFFVGNSGSGTVQILTGSKVTASSVSFGGTGSLTVSDAGSSLVANYITFAPFASTDGGAITVEAGGSIAVSQVTLVNSATSSIIVRGGTMTTGSLSSGGGPTSNIALSDPAGGSALTVGTNDSWSTFVGSISDADLGPGTVAKVGAGTLTLTGHLTNTGGYTATAGTIEFSGAVVQPGPGALVAAAGATIQYDTGARVFGGFLRGPGTHVITGGAILSGSTAFAGAVINQIGAGSLVNFTNGGNYTLAAGLASPAVFDGFSNEGSGSITLGSASKLNVTDFQSYGTLTLNPAAVGSGQFTELINVGASPMYFNGGSRTFLGTPATAGPPSNPSFVAGIDLGGKNAVVAGGLFVNNGFVVDTTTAPGSIIVDFGALYKGAGYTGVPIITQNGGKVQAGNSPGSASFGNFVFGPGGVSNYVFAIDDATGTAGPSPDALGHVSGWGLINAVKQSFGSGTASGDFTWTATPTDKLTFAIDTLVNPTTVGTDVIGPMADFDPASAYSWPAAHWAGTYAGPTDVATLDASTSFDTSGFLNPTAGTFGWSLSGSSLSLTYTPSAVPEPGTIGLVSAAAAGLACWRRRGSCLGGRVRSVGRARRQPHDRARPLELSRHA